MVDQEEFLAASLSQCCELKTGKVLVQPMGSLGWEHRELGDRATCGAPVKILLIGAVQKSWHSIVCDGSSPAKLKCRK